MAAIPPYPLYNRSYALYRVSPLHTDDTSLLTAGALRTHERRLTSQLKGDSIRGVEVNYGGAEGALGSLGPLEQCSWEAIGDEDDWINRHGHLVDPDASQLSAGPSLEAARGVQVTLEYESSAYNALLLRDLATTTSPKGFTSLPLLMLKMPAPLRAVFLHYLETAFDAHISPLRLSSTFLTSSLETYFRHLTAPSSTQSIEDVISHLQLQLSFPGVTRDLKHIDLAFHRNDLPGFIRRGKRHRPDAQRPFISALSLYLKHHLALNLSDHRVHFSRITCASFGLTTDRVKLFVPQAAGVSFIEDRDSPSLSPSQLALHDFYVALIREASGTGRFLSGHTALERASSTPPSDGNLGSQGARRKRAVSTTSASNAQAKRSKPRGKGNSSQTEDEAVDVDARDQSVDVDA
jgi:hypothetical protein